ncbi:DUF5719 family protein [Herbiconiux sp. A18JL235]|uniref:DUF5719 family protein n=1 Tax=Herbiconiux sp. A18JL235 TaxID=3152363 RepID=A0AB39BIV9_9MICO
MAAKGIATGARIATGVVTLAVAGGVAAAALLLPLPGVTATPASFTVEPQAAEQVRACAGPLVRLSDDSGQDATAISHVGTADVVSGTSPETQLDITPLASPDDRTSTEDAAPSRIALPVPDAGSADATLFAAAQSQTIASGELVGLAASSCGEASSESWMVAGSTTVGRTSFVVLANPGDVPAVVDLTVYGDLGAVEAPGGRNIDVPARSTRILSLAGLAPDLATPVIHVEASVGAVSAAVQQSVVRGLEPGGVELVGPSAPPATVQRVAGVQISGTSSIAERLSDSDNSDLQSVLRLFVPGTEPASVTLRVAEERNGGASTDYQVGLTPGIVTEFPLQDIPDGTYSVEAESDQPIVMGARTSTLVNGVTDFAWYQTLDELGTDFVVATADGPNPRLHLVNTTDADVEVTVAENGGETQSYTFVPGARSVALKPGSSYVVSSSGPVSAMVDYLGEGRSSAFAIAPPSPDASPLVIYP